MLTQNMLEDRPGQPDRFVTNADRFAFNQVSLCVVGRHTGRLGKPEPVLVDVEKLPFPPVETVA